MGEPSQMPPTPGLPSMTHPASKTMRHRAVWSLMTHCPFHCTLDEAAGLVCRGKRKKTAPKGVSEKGKDIIYKEI